MSRIQTHTLPRHHRTSSSITAFGTTPNNTPYPISTPHPSSSNNHSHNDTPYDVLSVTLNHTHFFALERPSPISPIATSAASNSGSDSGSETSSEEEYLGSDGDGDEDEGEITPTPINTSTASSCSAGENDKSIVAAVLGTETAEERKVERFSPIDLNNGQWNEGHIEKVLGVSVKPEGKESFLRVAEEAVHRDEKGDEKGEKGGDERCGGRGNGGRETWREEWKVIERKLEGVGWLVHDGDGDAKNHRDGNEGIGGAGEKVLVGEGKDIIQENKGGDQGEGKGRGAGIGNGRGRRRASSIPTPVNNARMGSPAGMARERNYRGLGMGEGRGAGRLRSGTSSIVGSGRM